MSVSIALINTKFVHNVGSAVRAASCFGATTVSFTGDRVELGKRLPREERMKDYQDVRWEHVDQRRVIDLAVARGETPVAIELLPNTESLHTFEHPENALYVYGPEDGSLPTGIRHACHRFVQIPSAHCLNLAAAVYITLYDRRVKRAAAGLEDVPGLDEDRGFWWHSPAIEEGAL